MLYKYIIHIEWQYVYWRRYLFFGIDWRLNTFGIQTLRGDRRFFRRTDAAQSHVACVLAIRKARWSSKCSTQNQRISDKTYKTPKGSKKVFNPTCQLYHLQDLDGPSIASRVERINGLGACCSISCMKFFIRAFRSCCLFWLDYLSIWAQCLQTIRILSEYYQIVVI